MQDFYALFPFMQIRTLIHNAYFNKNRRGKRFHKNRFSPALFRHFSYFIFFRTRVHHCFAYKLDEVLRRLSPRPSEARRNKQDEESAYFSTGAYYFVREREKTQARRSIAPLIRASHPRSRRANTTPVSPLREDNEDSRPCIDRQRRRG